MSPQREFGNYPLSIGTSLAIEGLLGQHPEHTNTIQPEAFDQLWVNLPTLIRNYFSAYSTEDLQSVQLPEVADHLLDELYHLQEVLNGLPKSLELVVYHQPIEELQWQFPHAVLKEPRTEKQRHIHHLNTYVYQVLLGVFERRDLPLLKLPATPPTQSKRVLMLTHHPHHLLWVFRFTSLMLLESHTGKIKGRDEWGSKLHTVRHEDHFPFTRTLIQLFGDNTLLAGVEPAIRREVKALGIEARWHALTTEERVRQTLSQKGSPELKAHLRNLK